MVAACERVAPVYLTATMSAPTFCSPGDSLERLAVLGVLSQDTRENAALRRTSRATWMQPEASASSPILARFVLRAAGIGEEALLEAKQHGDVVLVNEALRRTLPYIELIRQKRLSPQQLLLHIRVRRSVCDGQPSPSTPSWAVGARVTFAWQCAPAARAAPRDPSRRLPASLHASR